MRKPIHLQHPCIYYHHNLFCNREKICTFDHYELTSDEWKHHFPKVVFPGVGYLTRKPKDIQFKTEDFPVVGLGEEKPHPPRKPRGFPRNETTNTSGRTDDTPAQRKLRQRLKSAERAAGLVGDWVTPLSTTPEKPTAVLAVTPPVEPPGILILQSTKPKVAKTTWGISNSKRWADYSDEDDDVKDTVSVNSDVKVIVNVKRGVYYLANLPSAEYNKIPRDMFQLLEELGENLPNVLDLHSPSPKMPSIDDKLKSIITATLKHMLTIK
uniref:Uncharacterized protein n=1 Tax=Marseillevirus LCMAC201 TaxID=2506605 RepID=A0A481YVJ2_9VIRU|nr:MAG: hypothetical protein LCMAC201_00210 [Marseillevirus LCMAC201]